MLKSARDLAFTSEKLMSDTFDTFIPILGAMLKPSFCAFTPEKAANAKAIKKIFFMRLDVNCYE